MAGCCSRATGRGLYSSAMLDNSNLGIYICLWVQGLHFLLSHFTPSLFCFSPLFSIPTPSTSFLLFPPLPLLSSYYSHLLPLLNSIWLNPLISLCSLPHKVSVEGIWGSGSSIYQQWHIQKFLNLGHNKRLGAALKPPQAQSLSGGKNPCREQIKSLAYSRCILTKEDMFILGFLDIFPYWKWIIFLILISTVKHNHS